MQNWHFRISGKVIIDGDSQTMNIYPENIRDIIRISDYLNENTPRMLMHATLDKNLLDKILTNAKTAKIYLKIEKFDKQDEAAANRNYITYIEDEFSIFVSDDINYNKEIDYSSGAQELDGQREDVYKQVDIGLMSKSCIEGNKNFANTVFYKTDIFNMIGFYCKPLHLLIEPFKYNKTMDQLVIPPQETLVKTVAFLDNIKVFYDTQYLFFMDEPMCTYLISRSGQGLQKKDDLYLDVCFNILPKDNADSAIPGMAEDNQEKRYYIDINVADSKYTIDHDTSKAYTKIQEIINPDIDETISALDSIQDAVNSIGNVVNQIKDLGGSLRETFQSIPNDLYQYKMTFNSSVKDFLDSTVSDINSNVDRFKDLIQQLPTQITISSSSDSGSGSGSGSGGSTSTTYPVLTTFEKTQHTTTITNDNNNMNSTYGEVQALNPVFGGLTDDAGKVSYDMGKVDNHISCFTEVNVQDGVADTSRGINTLNTNAGDLNTNSQNKIAPKQHFVSDTKNNYDFTITDIQDTYNKAKSRIDAIKEAASGSGSDSGSGSSGESAELAKAEEILEQMKGILDILKDTSSTGINTKMNVNLGNINSSIDNFMKMPSAIKERAQNLAQAIPDLAKVAETNLKSKIKNIATDIRTIGKSAEVALGKIRNIGKSENLGFGFGDLFNAKDNLAAIGDLTGIGKLGISSFETKLKIGGCFGDAKEGVKILQTKNDNANKIKNIKSEMENMVNQISLNKYDLDPSVFTPNKRYTIKNYDGHNEKDGIFLLNRKTEVYMREDDTFTCNTMLDFCKVADASPTSNNGTASSSTQTSTNSTTQTKADKIATTNEGLANSAKNKNTSDTLYNTGQKVESNTNTGTSYLLNMATKAGFGSIPGYNNGINQDEYSILGTMSISDAIRKAQPK